MKNHTKTILGKVKEKRITGILFLQHPNQENLSDTLKRGKKIFLELIKPELRRITGHCTLKHHLKRMGKTTDDTCKLCFEEKETAKHVLCECVAVARIRLRHFGKGFMSLKMT